MRHREQAPADRLVGPDDNAPVPPARRPTRWTVRRVRAIASVLVGLAVAASLLSVHLTYQAAQESAAQAAAVDRRLAVLEEDLAERTRQRDLERDAAAARAAEDREQFRAHFCEVLAELSATFPNLDRLREALGCTQPGTPDAPAATAPSPDPPGPRGPGTSPRPASPSPTTSPPAPPGTPPPARPAPPAPSLLNDLLCGVLPRDC